MKYDYVDPFVNTVERVLSSALRTEIRRGELALTACGRVCSDVAIDVRIAGDSEGDITLTMSADTARWICSVLSGEDISPLTPLGMDALSELANMIAGNAVSALNDEGFDFTVQPPRVLNDADAGVLHPHAEALSIPLLTARGEVTVNIVLGTDRN